MFEIHMLASDVMVWRVEGHANVELASLAISRVEALLALGGKPSVFCDLSAGKGYESQARIRLTSWLKRARNRLGDVQVLVKSGLFAMGVSVLNLELDGSIVVHRERLSFNEALTATLASHDLPKTAPRGRLPST